MLISEPSPPLQRPHAPLAPEGPEIFPALRRRDEQGWRRAGGADRGLAS